MSNPAVSFPQKTFYPKPKNGIIRFGIENELRASRENSSKAKEVVMRNAKRFFWSYDGSLRDSDLEVVSKPFAHTPSNMDVLCNFFQEIEPFANIPKERCNGVSYGLHVTVSGYETTVAQRARMFLQKHKRMAEKVAGREENRYCSYKETESTACHKSCAINIRSNGSAEFRIFKATTVALKLKYRVQFALSVMHFASEYPGGTAYEYSKFIKSLRRYAEISEFVEANFTIKEAL